MISIIVPVYNVKDYVEKCLNSIKNQTLKGIEVIVVDDGSTDGSGELVDEFCADLDNFHVYHKENGGLMSAWMYGVEQSHGDYIGFVDSDDYVEHEMYAEMYAKACEYYADIVLCNHMYVEIDETEKQILHSNPIQEGFYEGASLQNIKDLIFPRINKDYISPSRWSKLIKRELLLNNLKYCDERITSAEDVNSIIPCLLGMKSFYYIDKPFYYYVKRNTSISNVFKEGILDTYSFLISKLYQTMIDNNYKNTETTEISLWNFYGYLWCTYVLKSNLKLKDKNKQINRLCDIDEFRNASAKITGGIGEKIYKFSVRHRCGGLFVIMKKIQSIFM